MGEFGRTILPIPDNIECNICSLKEGTTFDLAYGPWVELYAKKIKGQIFIGAVGDGRAEYTPKYCPMCGRQIFKEWWED